MKLFTFAFLALAGLAQAGTVAYKVQVNTSALAGVNGYLELQFNKGGVDADDAQAVVTDFSPAAGLAGIDPSSLGYSGALPGPMTLSNTALNDYFQSITFGSNLYFFVTISGVALDPPAGAPKSNSDFSLILWSDATTPVSTPDPLGTNRQINLGIGNGTATAATFATSASLTQIPEPSTWLLLSGALAGLAFLRRRQGSILTH